MQPTPSQPRGQSPPTALERRERRPTGTVLFLAALFALPIGTCGGIGGWKAKDIGETNVPIATGEIAKTADGTYVAFDATLRHVATDELPLTDRTIAVAHGVSIFAVEPTTSAYVAAKKGDLAAGRVHVEGRVCSPDSHLVCSVDDDGVRIFLREEQKRGGREVKVVMAGATPRDNVVEAVIGLGVAGVLAVLLAVVAGVIVRGRRKPLVFVERVATVRPGFEVASLGHALGSGFRAAQISQDAVVLLTGVPASRAQLLGAFRPEDLPQRVEVWLEPGASGYRQAQARVRVSEIFAQPAGPLPQIMPTVNAALEATMQRVLAALVA